MHQWTLPRHPGPRESRLRLCESKLLAESILGTSTGIHGLFDVTPESLEVLVPHHCLQFGERCPSRSVKTCKRCPQAMGCEVAHSKGFGGCQKGFAQKPRAMRFPIPCREDPLAQGPFGHQGDGIPEPSGNGQDPGFLPLGASHCVCMLRRV